MAGIKQYTQTEFGKRLYDKILEKDITFTSLSKITGISRTLIYAYIYDCVNPSVVQLVKLCSVLNVSADYLLFGEERR